MERNKKPTFSNKQKFHSFEFQILVSASLSQWSSNSLKFKFTFKIMKFNKSQNKSLSLCAIDCEMPIVDGWETTKKIQDMKIKKEILYPPVVIERTANSLENIQQKYHDARIDDIS